MGNKSKVVRSAVKRYYVINKVRFDSRKEIMEKYNVTMNTLQLWLRKRRTKDGDIINFITEIQDN